MQAASRKGRKSPKPVYLLGRDDDDDDDPGVVRLRKVPSPTHVPPWQHPLKVGIPGKLYSPFDYVTPIIDSMNRLNERAYGTGMGRIVQRQERQKVREILASAAGAGSSGSSLQTSQVGDEFGIDEYCSNTTQYAIVRPKPTKPGALCHNCGTTNPASMTVDNTTHRLVCEDCGAEGQQYSYGTDYKETNDTEKSKARADVSSYANKAHELRFLGKAALGTGTRIATSAKKKNKLGYAQEKCNKEAELADELKLSKGNQRKLTSIIEAIDEFIAEMSPVDASIARKLRMDASWIFRQSLNHHEKCGKKECQKALLNKPAKVIARESFSYTIDTISASDGFDNVAKQTIVSLQQRVHNSHVFNHLENATQHQSCLAMISAISTTDNCVVCPDAATEEGLKTPDGARSKAPAGDVPVGNVAMRRQDSDVLSSPLMQMRDAIRRLSIEYSYSREVRDAAMCALQDGEFSKHIIDSPVTSRKATNFASAYVLLRSVSEEIGKPNSARLQQEQCRKVGLADSEVESMVQQMRGMLPNTAMASGSGDYDDELY
jgi:hypothetical protein